MPELPEVETTLRGIAPHLHGQKIIKLKIMRRDLRTEIPKSIFLTKNRTIHSLQRRGKYIIISLEQNHHIIIHLGMSGSLRITHSDDTIKKHDHVILSLSSGLEMRFHDPRRFGVFTHFQHENPLDHPHFHSLGYEPWDEKLTTKYLSEKFKNKHSAVKQHIMDSHILVGVGNIYASESLFHAGIHPDMPASKLSLKKLEALLTSVRNVLEKSIMQGGTTLRDFLHADGTPGYFQQTLYVYDRDEQPCRVCGTLIMHSTHAKRSTYFCPKCQKK